MKRLVGLLAAVCLGCIMLCSTPVLGGSSGDTPTTHPTVGQWGLFEITLQGPSGGNPFDDVALSAHFTCGTQAVDASGFYDGAGTYRIRFMPMTQGEWSYQTRSNRPELAGKTGQFTCSSADAGNHGPVGVMNHFHFAYADGTPYYECGTTAYEWTSQPTTQESQTLDTLKSSPFNKIRMCVFPSEYSADNVPARWPFEPADPGSDYTKFNKTRKQWNFSRINPAFFQNLDRQVQKLADGGVEADVILFHPYAKTLGFAAMPAGDADRYLHYVIARLSAYHNVWWSLANEYDHLHAFNTADWDRLFEIIKKDDAYHHLRSIQQDRIVYSTPLMTHASIQGNPGAAAAGDRKLYGMPVVFDEVKYEGDIPVSWGNLTGQAMVDRFWTATVLGTYAGHGETFKTNGWSGVGGRLIGQSPARLAFFRSIMQSSPADGIEPIDRNADCMIGGQTGKFYFVYFGAQRPPKDWLLKLPAPGLTVGSQMHVDVIDTWNMTTTPVDRVFTMARSNHNDFVANDKAIVPMPDTAGLLLRVTPIRAKSL